jgi:hypothetical protein
MARKIYYSRPLKFFWQELYATQKKLTPYFYDDQIFAILRRNILAAPDKSFEFPEMRGLMVSGLELWREDAAGKLMHIFFLDRQLRDFLQDTQLSDIQGIKNFLYENGRDHEVLHLYSKEQTRHVIYRFALHLPYEAQGYAFSLSIEQDGSVELYFSHGENGGRMADKFYKDTFKRNDQIALEASKMFRLAINTIAYMKCFPDCVADRVPKDLLEKTQPGKAGNFTVGLSDKIRDNGNSPLSKIPHFRKGHFRVLHSDYFANKKGQVVFVAETMVKGKAKTVSTSPDIDEFANGSKTDTGESSSTTD